MITIRKNTMSNKRYLSQNTKFPAIARHKFNQVDCYRVSLTSFMEYFSWLNQGAEEGRRK